MFTRRREGAEVVHARLAQRLIDSVPESITMMMGRDAANRGISAPPREQIFFPHTSRLRGA